MGPKHEEHFYHDTKNRSKRHCHQPAWVWSEGRSLMRNDLHEMLISKGVDRWPWVTIMLYHPSDMLNILFGTYPKGRLCTNYHPRDEIQTVQISSSNWGASEQKLRYGDFSTVVSNFNEARSVEISYEKLSCMLAIFSRGFRPPKGSLQPFFWW